MHVRKEEGVLTVGGAATFDRIIDPVFDAGFETGKLGAAIAAPWSQSQKPHADLGVQCKAPACIWGWWVQR